MRGAAAKAWGLEIGIAVGPARGLPMGPHMHRHRARNVRNFESRKGASAKPALISEQQPSFRKLFISYTLMLRGPVACGDYHDHPKGLGPKGLEPKGPQATDMDFVSRWPETGLQPQVVDVSGPQFLFEPKRRMRRSLDKLTVSLRRVYLKAHSAA